jgi:hypothetical protein
MPLQQVAVFSRTWRAPARHMFTWLESFNEKDMPTRPLHASPSIHSCEIIFGETTAEKCANYFSLRRKVRKPARDTGKLFLAIQTCCAGWRSATEIKYTSIPALCGIYWPARRAAGQVLRKHGNLQQVAVFSRTWRAPARHMFTWLESFDEKDMPTRPLRASPSIHSCEIIFGETTAEKCAN